MKSHFIENMLRHFGDRPYTGGQVEGWQQLESALTNTPQLRSWQIIQWPTGTGKTQALSVLCATPETGNHPGALIITKFTKEADKIADDINANANAIIALALHTKNKLPTEQAIVESPVLVITQEKYRAALREAQDRPDAANRLALYHRHHQGTRQWIVADEAFNWIDSYAVDLDQALAMCAALSTHIPCEESLHQLSCFLDQLAEEQRVSPTDRLMPSVASLSEIDFARLRNAVQGLPVETTELWRNAELHLRTNEDAGDNTVKRTSFKSEYTDLLDDLDAIKRIGRCWLSKRRTRSRLHSSRLLLDTDRPCGVILDATANLDRTYDLLGGRVTLLPRPNNMRSYRNVSVHISRPHSVGKEHLTKQAATDWPILAERISDKLSTKSRMFIVTHKCNKHRLRPRLSCATQDIGHWGDLDGKNEWRHSDTVLIYGLPYRDDIEATDLFFACTGLWSADWFAGKRAYGGYADIKVAIKQGLTARSVIQAINRARCRTIIDAEGNCAPTDVFILLPRGTVGDTIVAAIRDEMPGASVVQWTALPAKECSMTEIERKLVLDFAPLTKGQTRTKTQVVKHLEVSSRTVERMTSKLRDPNSLLAQELAATGVEFRRPMGQGEEAYFIKH